MPYHQLKLENKPSKGLKRARKNIRECEGGDPKPLFLVKAAIAILTEILQCINGTYQWRKYLDGRCKRLTPIEWFLTRTSYVTRGRMILFLFDKSL